VNSNRLLNIARVCCGHATSKAILEPLIADLQQELVGARTSAQRRSVRLKGMTAFWMTLAYCVARRMAQWPARITFMSGLVACYWIAIVFVIVYGVTWVQTGSLDATDGSVRVRWLIALFGPLALYALVRTLPWIAASRLRQFATIGLFYLVEFSLVPNHRLNHLAILAVCIGQIYREMAARPGAVEHRP
jgi:hypothetical protein